MNEEILGKVQPPDKIDRTSDGWFKGKVYFFDKQGILEEWEININPTSPLSDFYYNKPIPGSDPLRGPARFERDKKPRSGYYPLQMMHAVRRQPNHMYRSNDAFLAATNTGTEEKPKWETRFFPKGCLDEETWEEAKDILRTTIRLDRSQ